MNNKLHLSPLTSIKDNDNINNDNNNTINVSKNLFCNSKVNQKGISDFGLFKAMNLKLTQFLAETKLLDQV